MPTPIAQKLQLKPGQTLVILNAPQGYMDELMKALKDNTLSPKVAKKAEAVLAFVSTLAEVKKIASQAIRAVKLDGLLWIAYAKGGSGLKTDVNRDKLREAVQAEGWDSVRLVALDEVWSAMRFRPAKR